MYTIIGCDLGTTFSALAIADPLTLEARIIRPSEEEAAIPSAIQMTAQGARFGTEAKDAIEAGEMGCMSAFKRSMGETERIYEYGGDAYNSEELSAMLLGHLKEVAERGLGRPVDEAVITVPAYFLATEIEATMRAARAAGLTVNHIIYEPTAAALAFGAKKWRPGSKILVYDLGGGTFDATLCEMLPDRTLKVLNSEGNKRLGGKDWDEAVAQCIAQKIQEQRGGFTQLDIADYREIASRVESVKKKLSSVNTAQVRVKLSDGETVEVSITRAQFEEVTSSLMAQTGAMMQALLHKTSVTWANIDDVLLVGGSTKMPMVSSYIESVCGKTPLKHINPDEAVALGAAIYAVIKPQGEDDTPSIRQMALREESVTRRAQGLPVEEEDTLGIRLINATTHAMGVVAVSESGDRYINRVIVPEGEPIPAKRARKFLFHTSPNQENRMEALIMQGKQEDPLRNQMPHKYVISGIRDQSGQHAVVLLQYSYDRNSIIHVQARQEGVGDLQVTREDVTPEDRERLAGRPQTGVGASTLLLATDLSGSMSGSPLADAKRAMHHEFVDRIDLSTNQIGIIGFSDRVRMYQKPSHNAGEIHRAIDQMGCADTGVLNSGHPFGMAQELFAQTGGRRVLIVLADGVWNAGAQSASRSMARSFAEQGIEVCAIGFGSADLRFLRDISTSEANAILTNQSGLGQAFGSIAQVMAGGASGASEESDAVPCW